MPNAFLQAVNSSKMSRVKKTGLTMKCMEMQITKKSRDLNSLCKDDMVALTRGLVD